MSIVFGSKSVVVFLVILLSFVFTGIYFQEKWINQFVIKTSTSSDHASVGTSPPTPFKDFISQFEAEDVLKWTSDDYGQFIQGIQEFHYKEPLVPVNASCKPPPLPQNVICDRQGFKGEQRSQPAKVGHAIQFGFDIDTLEIHLHELYDVVDKFFILEFVSAHNPFMKSKTLSWDHVKTQPRFRTIKDKVVHFVLDDLDVADMKHSVKEGMWRSEGFQERRRWEKIRDWNNKTNFFGKSDLIGFGDTDEVASRENIQILKECSFDKHVQSVDIGIWFPFGRIDEAFQTDWPVSGHRYSLGDPTFWTFQSAQNHAQNGKTPGRNRGTSKGGFHLVGGMHMTHYGYFPYHIIKDFAATEYRGTEKAQQVVLGLIEASKTEDGLKELNEKKSTDLGLRKRIKKLKDINPQELEGLVYLPWFYDCNRDRYPRWEGKLDSRLGL